jgi:16S rRNA (guanine527-N7)-methyltransferase
MSQFKELFTEIFQNNGLEIYIRDDNIEKFEKLTEIMIQTNAVMNITASTTIEKIIPLHYADCVKIAEKIPEGATVIDIGCGGGFPILPLAIVRPDLKITGLDSTDKKVRYVQNTAHELGLRISTLSARAEEAAKMVQYRDFFDVAISRAVARMNLLDELCMPFVKVGGTFIAMKGAAGQEELDEAQNGIEKLGGVITKMDEYDLYTGHENEKRTVIEITKLTATPKEFPRGFGAIKKKPL